MANPPSEFHPTALDKNDLQITDSGKVAFKNKEIADAIEFELAASTPLEARATTNTRCVVNQGCRPRL